MKDNGATAVERDALHAQIDKLNRSSVLHGSESLCKLLRYLAENSLEAPGTSLKEYQIATEVFGRPSDFDSRVDSTVRVQTGRLRSKLSEYYAGEGAADRMLIEIPKGSYSLTYHQRPVVEPPPPPPMTLPEPPAPAPVQPQRQRAYPLSWFLTSAAVAILILLAGGWLIGRWISPQSGARTDQPSPAIKSFWTAFTTSPDAPLVVYSNAEFVGRPETGVRYYKPAIDAGKPILDHYTGVGEVMAVHDLDGVFAALKREIHIKRGRLLTWDDAKASDLIFIGSPSENLSLRELRGSQDFVFMRKPDTPRKGDLMISNLDRKS